MITPSTLIHNLDRQRPLLICDVDEVVLHFIAPFQTYLAERNMLLRKTSFKLGGNVINTATKETLSAPKTSELVLEFHKHSVDQQPIIDDAQAMLTLLSAHFQIVFLTNVAEDLTNRRARHLSALGLPFPVLQNTGSKAETVAQLSDYITPPTIFIDDLPAHHRTIKTTSPDVFCIHFMADNDFRSLAEVDLQIIEKAENWQEIKTFCMHKI